MRTTLVPYVRFAHVPVRGSRRVDPCGSFPLLAYTLRCGHHGWHVGQRIQPPLRFTGPIIRSNGATTGHLGIDRGNCRSPYGCDVPGEHRACVVMQRATSLTVLQTHPCGPPFVTCPIHANVVTPSNDLDV